MREVTAMAQLCEESSKAELLSAEVTLTNLRCLMSTDLCCSPPPCPPPSSTSSSASSSPRPDGHPESPDMSPAAGANNDERTSSPEQVRVASDLLLEGPLKSQDLALSSSTMVQNISALNQQDIALPNNLEKVQQLSDRSSVVQIILEAQEKNIELKTKEQIISDEYNRENSENLISISSDIKNIDENFCLVSPLCESSETDDDDNDSVESVISREVVTWDSLSPRAPLAAEEETDDEEGARVDKVESGAQNQVACGSAALEAAAATAVAAVEAVTVVAVQSEVHARGSILSNLVKAREEVFSLTNSCSSEVSGLASGSEAEALSSCCLNDVSLTPETPALSLPPELPELDKMRQKPSGSSSAAPNNEGNVQQQQHHQEHHQSSNNNSDCPLQCNGMVSECCWNGDCVEARTTKTNLKPAIKLNTEKRQENGKRRVTFNETLNKFFDADYVILVGEDCNGDETTRLVSMCKKSNCQPGGNFDLNFPELCPFEPPLEYIDQVTLSPPEGYKDVLGAARSAQDDESESESSGEARSEDEDGGQSPVCEQCSACSACASQQQQQLQQQQQRYIVETITLTTVTERRIVREANDTDEPRLSGILKGGKLWKNGEGDSASTPSEDGETSARRSVRFCEDELERKSDDDENGEIEQDNITDEINEELNNTEIQPEESETTIAVATTITSNHSGETKSIEEKNNLVKEQQSLEQATENTELTLSFRLGTTLLLSDKLPANSAVRQLFPDSEAQQRLLGVATSPAAAEGDSKDVSESDVPSLPSPGQTGPTGSSSDDEAAARTSTQIRRTIERNALRRSLLRCSEPLRRRPPPRADENSLVERIRQLTCDVDDDEELNRQQNDQLNERSSPPGQLNKNEPSTYKKLTELFSRRERCHSESGPSSRPEPLSLPSDNSCCWLMVDPVRPPPDFTRNSVSLPPHTVSPTTSLPPPGTFVGPKPAMSRINVSAEARKQFLSTLGERETPPDGSANVGDRTSVTETAYSLEDIDEALGECACPNINGQLASNQPPDVVATAQEQQQRNEPVDELALFVQRDMGRIERIKKRYSLTDDDQDDYGFSRRPSVRGIKPRFGSTTEILQQIQLQLQPPALACPTRAGSHLTWPYAAEPGPVSPASSPSEPPPPRRRQPGLPAPRGANGLPVLPEDSYYATVPTQDYRYLEYSTQNGGSGTYMYASTGNLYPRNEIVPYNPRIPQQALPNCDSPPPCVVRGASTNAVYSQQAHPQYPSQVYGTVTRRNPVVPAPVHYSNGTLPHPGYVARNGGRLPAMSYAPQTHARSDSPQRMYHRQAPNYYPAPVAPAVVTNGRYYPPQPGYSIAPKNYSQQELPSPSQRTLSPVPAGSPTRVAKFERGAPEGASASPGFNQDSYAARVEQTSVVSSPAQGSANPGAPSPSSVYYAMNV